MSHFLHFVSLEIIAEKHTFMCMRGLWRNDWMRQSLPGNPSLRCCATYTLRCHFARNTGTREERSCTKFCRKLGDTRENQFAKFIMLLVAMRRVLPKYKNRATGYRITAHRWRVTDQRSRTINKSHCNRYQGSEDLNNGGSLFGGAGNQWQADSVHAVLKEDLDMRCVVMNFVLKMLSQEQQFCFRLRRIYWIVSAVRILSSCIP